MHKSGQLAIIILSFSVAIGVYQYYDPKREHLHQFVFRGGLGVLGWPMVWYRDISLRQKYCPSFTTVDYFDVPPDEKYIQFTNCCSKQRRVWHVSCGEPPELRLVVRAGHRTGFGCPRTASWDVWIQDPKYIERRIYC